MYGHDNHWLCLHIVKKDNRIKVVFENISQLSFKHFGNQILWEYKNIFNKNNIRAIVHKKNMDHAHTKNCQQLYIFYKNYFL